MSEKLTIELTFDAEKMLRDLSRIELRSAQLEIERLRARVDSLLIANNREVARRREGEALLREDAETFRFYERSHRAKLNNKQTSLNDRVAAEAKADRNAELAGRIDTFLAGAAA